jgi:hypothetical protein
MRWLYGSLLILVGLFLIFAAVRTPEQKPNPAAGDTVPTQAYSPDKHCTDPGFGRHPYFIDYGDGSGPVFLFCW